MQIKHIGTEDVTVNKMDGTNESITIAPNEVVELDLATNEYLLSLVVVSGDGAIAVKFEEAST